MNALPAGSDSFRSMASTVRLRTSYSVVASSCEAMQSAHDGEALHRRDLPRRIRPGRRGRLRRRDVDTPGRDATLACVLDENLQHQSLAARRQPRAIAFLDRCPGGRRGRHGVDEVGELTRVGIEPRERPQRQRIASLHGLLDRGDQQVDPVRRRQTAVAPPLQERARSRAERSRITARIGIPVLDTRRWRFRSGIS